MDVAAGVALTDIVDSPAFPLDENLGGHPILLGADVGYEWHQWLGAELWAGYEFDVHRWQLLLGPRAKARLGVVCFSAGLKGGVLVSGPTLFQWNQVRPGISPDAAVELELGPKFFLGFRYALDVAIQHDPVLTHRIVVTEGWRF